MLQYSPWKTEQNEFDPQQEALLEEQLAFSNGYISQYAYFEEPYSGEQRVGTFVEGVLRASSSSPLEIPNPAVISVRLGDERLDLHYWQTQRFYRCLHKGEARLERHFTATSPKGHTVEVDAARQLNMKNPHLLEISYSVRFVDYEGLISFLTLISDSKRFDEWYTLQASIDDKIACMWLQAKDGDKQVSVAQRHWLYKNGALQDDRAVKIDKKNVLGFAHMTDVVKGDVFTMKTVLSIVDSTRFMKSELTAKAIENLPSSL